MYGSLVLFIEQNKGADSRHNVENGDSSFMTGRDSSPDSKLALCYGSGETEELFTFRIRREKS